MNRSFSPPGRLSVAKDNPSPSILRDSLASSLSTARDFGEMMIPFTNKERGAARINASLRSFAKPGTWFAPMWAVVMGVISSPHSGWNFATLGRVALLMIMAGPLLCAFSQVINDHYDRDVDRINEPLRPTAANQLGGRTIAIVALVLAGLALSIAFYLGTSVGYLALVGLFLAFIYSAPPLRLKALDGWLANGACAFAYEGMAWLAGAAAFGHMSNGIIAIAICYSLGAHGLMTLNDFKSLEGDKKLGLRSIPVMLGVKGALRQAVVFINLFQACAMAYVLSYGAWIEAAAMNLLLILQLPMQMRLARDPKGNAPWYCAAGIPLFCWSMLAAALALRFGRF